MVNLLHKVGAKEVNVMNTIAIDRNTINDLLDNQKKLDELFDSIFDDDNYLIRDSSASSQTDKHYPKFDDEKSPWSYEGDSVKESQLAVRKHNPYYFVLPIALEIAAIYYVVANLV